MCFAYAGTPAFFALAAEMREPRHYVRSLALCQGSVTAIYIAVSTVVYYYCGSYVASPALGSAGNKMKLIAYAVSLPGLFVTATVLGHASSSDPRTTRSSLTSPDPRQIHLRPRPPWLQTSHRINTHPLDDLVGLHIRHHHGCLRRRQRHPHF